MTAEPDPIVRTTEQARSGATPHILRYILGISLTLAIALLSGIWIIGTMLK